MSATNKLYRAAVAVAVAAVVSACASTHGLAPQSSMNKPDTLQTSATLANSAVGSDAWPAAPCAVSLKRKIPFSPQQTP